jgi:hypothetical protein
MDDVVEFLPTMTRKQLSLKYRYSHFGIGTLALQRSGQRVAFSLKHVEFAAFGLPFIMCSGDPMFETSSFVLTIEQDEAPVDIDHMIKFYEKLRSGSKNYAIEFRNSVGNLITWDRQLNNVFSVFLGEKTRTSESHTSTF